MKRTFCLLMVVCIFFSMAGCGCNHVWNEPSCNAPKTCSECGATEGEPVEHTWEEATYTAPKTCSVCGLTEGAPEESPYKNCKTWEDVFAVCFEDEFTVKNEDNTFILTFSGVDNIDEFMMDAVISTITIGMPSVAGVFLDDKVEGALFCLEGVGSIAAAKLDNALLGVATDIFVEEGVDEAEEMQKIYDEYFAALDLYR